MTEPVTKDRILSALRNVKAPGGGGDIVSAGMLSEIVINKDKVYFSISVPKAEARNFETLRQSAEETVKSVPGVASALVTLTAEAKQPPQMPRAAKAGTPKTNAPQMAGQGIGAVKHIVAVASGKGGVGKSTTAVNLALGLAANGLRVGLLDADIYGPSMPRLLAIRGKPELLGNSVIRPMDSYGIKVMSMGFLVDEETPMIWRGPMVISAITQMLRDVAWGELDIMVVDMPPGTGDAQLTLAQQVPLSGAIIVSTPQDLALIDARKGLNMFKRVDVPVLGIIENMSFFLCPNCGHRSDIFSHGGAHEEAKRLGVPFLGELPLDMSIRETSDGGRPIVVAEPSSTPAQLYRNIADTVWSQVTSGAGAPVAPNIVME
jgi:ATP-binding protein involved in chromosome partitioning